MKKILIASLALVLTGSVHAQQVVKAQGVQTQKAVPVTNEQKAENFAGRWMKELGLTLEQKKEVYNAKLEQLVRIGELDAKYTGETRAAHKAEYEKVQSDFDAKMKTILSAEQYTKWKAEKAKRKVDAVEHKQEVKQN